MVIKQSTPSPILLELNKEIYFKIKYKSKSSSWAQRLISLDNIEYHPYRKQGHSMVNRLRNLATKYTDKTGIIYF